MFKMLVVLLVLSGCSTINKLECRKANWKQVGLDDGNKGLPSMLDEYERSCLKNKIIPDGDEYREGHKIGVAQYCTEENGYILGEIGKDFPFVCTGNHWFKGGYKQGRAKFLKNKGKSGGY